MTNIKYTYAEDGTRTLQHCLDNYSIDTYRRCPRAYQYKVLQGYSPRVSANDKQFGVAFHTAMEHFELNYKLGVSFDDSLAAALARALLDLQGLEFDSYYNPENLIRAVTCYLHEYPRTGEVLAVEQRYEVPLVGAYSMSLRVDKLIKDDNGDMWISDYKTTKKTVGDFYFNKYALDSQISGYIWAMRKLGYPVKGFIVDAIQLAVSFNKYVKMPIIRSDWQLDEWYQSTINAVTLLEHDWRKKNYHQNFSNCWNCSFTSICSKEPSLRSTFLEMDFLQNLEVK